MLHIGKQFDFLVDEVELPSGRRTRREVVKHPGAIAVVPILPDERIVLVKQYRYAAEKVLLEIPAGTLEPGEPPLFCARRELKEETGYEAFEMSPLLNCYMAPGYSSEVIYYFVAKGLKLVGDDQDEDEEISLEKLELSRVKMMIKENVIEDAKTIIGILALSI
ncbi:MAG: NUDIX hydrolase [Candidatus Bathyarchaeota archaeon]